MESWYRGERVGGLYGVALGRMFYGESMFAQRTDASKIALAALCAFLDQHGVTMIDCQQETDHLALPRRPPHPPRAIRRPRPGRNGTARHRAVAVRQSVLARWAPAV